MSAHTADGHREEGKGGGRAQGTVPFAVPRYTTQPFVELVPFDPPPLPANIPPLRTGQELLVSHSACLPSPAELSLLAPSMLTSVTLPLTAQAASSGVPSKLSVVSSQQASKQPRKVPTHTSISHLCLFARVVLLVTVILEKLPSVCKHAK